MTQGKLEVVVTGSNTKKLGRLNTIRVLSPRSIRGLEACPIFRGQCVKINELPQAKNVENGWQQFEIDCDGRVITITVKPKVWKKLTDAATNYPQWVAAISGKMGEITENGFVLLEPNIQTFEKKPKAEAATV